MQGIAVFLDTSLAVDLPLSAGETSRYHWLSLHSTSYLLQLPGAAVCM